MLRLPRFRYRRATSVAEAAALLAGEGAAEGRARPVAGGTDLWPNMKRRHQKAETVVGLTGIAALRGIAANGDLHLGATTLLAEIAESPAVRARWPALARAVGGISTPPVRYNQPEEWRRSIDYCMKEEGTVCWVAPSSPRCWAHSASDAAPMLCALGARVRLASTEGEREIPVAALYRDDGIDYLTKKPEEIVTAIVVPAAADAGHCRSSFWKLRRRGSIDFAVLSAAVAVWTGGDGVVADARIVLGAVASYPVPAAAAARALLGRPLTAETIAHAAALARRDATPMDNTDFQAQWRGAVVGKYVEAALRDCAGLPVERLAPKHAQS
jgi:4-hydroxybenzoyl-CoA reductase subunit beta